MMPDGHLRTEKKMDAAKIYDIEYPGATAGVVIADVPMTISGLMAEVGGTFEVTRVVRPTKVEYDYVPVARN